jgi:hypothetical protein
MAVTSPPYLNGTNYFRNTKIELWLLGFIENEQELKNLRREAISAGLMTFKSRMEERGDFLWTEKWYHRAVGREHRDRLAKEFDFHVDLVMDLTLELTRAANYVCDRVRESLDPSFRMEEGLLLAQSGPYVIDRWDLHSVQYCGVERTLLPYPGLERFKIERGTRDMNFGEGSGLDDPNCKIAGYP